MKENNARSHVYEIVIRGHLQPRYAGWFEGMELTQQVDGTTTLRGKVNDQAALHGLLSRIRDLGLLLVSLRLLETAQDTRSP